MGVVAEGFVAEHPRLLQTYVAKWPLKTVTNPMFLIRCPICIFINTHVYIYMCVCRCRCRHVYIHMCIYVYIPRVLLGLSSYSLSLEAALWRRLRGFEGARSPPTWRAALPNYILRCPTWRSMASYKCSYERANNNKYRYDWAMQDVYHQQWYGPLFRDPYKPHYNTIVDYLHERGPWFTSDPFKEAKGALAFHLEVQGIHSWLHINAAMIQM